MPVRPTLNLFAVEDLQEVLRKNFSALQLEVNRADADYVLGNNNEEEYTHYLTNKYAISPIRLDFDSLDEESRHVARHFQQVLIIVVRIPFEGDRAQLNYRPSVLDSPVPTIYQAGNTIYFEVETIGREPEAIRKEMKRGVEAIKERYQQFYLEISHFNKTLAERARPLVINRKRQLLAEYKLLEAILVPHVKPDGKDKSLIVPSIEPRPIELHKTRPSHVPFKPDPRLEESAYVSLLENLSRWLSVMEKHESIYANRSETDFRDLILMNLCTSLRLASATGETFNAAGKTDILIKYETSNLFVAECKIWRGEKSFLGALSQTMSYLTWRDTQAALIVFVKQPDISAVLDSIAATVPKHPNHVRHTGSHSIAWANYHFHINNDPGRIAKLAVHVAHVPKRTTRKKSPI